MEPGPGDTSDGGGRPAGRLWGHLSGTVGRGKGACLGSVLEVEPIEGESWHSVGLSRTCKKWDREAWTVVDVLTQDMKLGVSVRRWRRGQVAAT